MVNVIDDNGQVIARVEYDDNLDYWDGSNHSCGSTGHHKGLTKLTNGKYVLIHGTQWQGERDWAEIISPARALQEILKSGNEELLEKYPDLSELAEQKLVAEESVLEETR